MNNARFRICYFCVGVCSLWLMLSAGIVLGYLSRQMFLIPIALLMGGTVVGIAYQRSSLRWKIAVTLTGMPTAYFLVVNLNAAALAVEFILLIAVALALFFRRESADSEQIRGILKKMQNCC